MVPDRIRKLGLLTTAEAAELIGVSREAVRLAIEARELRARRIGVRYYGIVPDELARYAAERWGAKLGHQPLFRERLAANRRLRPQRDPPPPY